MTQFNPAETFLRNDTVVADVNVKQRIIDLIAVPWDQFADVPWRGEMWREVFRRGAFDGLEGHATRIRVNREHEKGRTVGKLISADPYAEAGLITRSLIARTREGDDSLALAEDDMLSGSVGYRINKQDDLRLDRRTKVREVMRAMLDHLSLVESPAFAGATVLAVREDQSDLAEEAPPYAQAINEAYANPAYLAALERLNRN